MSRSVAVTEKRQTTVFRVVRVTRDPENGVATRYIGLFDTVAPARGMVTKIHKAWEKHGVTTLSPFVGDKDREDPTELLDCWVEPVTVVNHPGVRYEDGWMSPDTDAVERFRAIFVIADAMNPPGDSWAMTWAITRLALGTFTVEDARQWLDWESL